MDPVQVDAMAGLRLQDDDEVAPPSTLVSNAWPKVPSLKQDLPCRPKLIEATLQRQAHLVLD